MIKLPLILLDFFIFKERRYVRNLSVLEYRVCCVDLSDGESLMVRGPVYARAKGRALRASPPKPIQSECGARPASGILLL